MNEFTFETNEKIASGLGILARLMCFLGFIHVFFVSCLFMFVFTIASCVLIHIIDNDDILFYQLLLFIT